MEYQTTSNDPGRTVAIVSYITLIGLIVAFIMHGDTKNKSSLGVFHLRQAVGIFTTFFALWIAQIIFVFIPLIGWAMNIFVSLTSIGLFICWILGLISAINGTKKAIPYIGDYYQEIFKGIQ